MDLRRVICGFILFEQSQLTVFSPVAMRTINLMMWDNVIAC